MASSEERAADPVVVRPHVQPALPVRLRDQQRGGHVQRDGEQQEEQKRVEAPHLHLMQPPQAPPEEDLADEEQRHPEQVQSAQAHLPRALHHGDDAAQQVRHPQSEHHRHDDGDELKGAHTPRGAAVTRRYTVSTAFASCPSGVTLYAVMTSSSGVGSRTSVRHPHGGPPSPSG